MSIGAIELDGRPNFIADAHIKRGSRVTLDSSGLAVLAGADERGIGTAYLKDYEPGDLIAVRLWNDAGVHLCLAAGSIPVGSKIVPAANGQVAAAGEGVTNILGVRASASKYPVEQSDDHIGVVPLFT